MAEAVSYPRAGRLPHLGVRISGFSAVSIVLLLMLRLGIAPEIAAGIVITLVIAGVRLVRL